MDKHQKLAKLARMCEEATAWAKKSEIQVFALYEAKDKMVERVGYFSEDMLVNLAYWLAKEHPAAISRARMVMIEEMGQDAVKRAEDATERPPLTIVRDA